MFRLKHFDVGDIPNGIFFRRYDVLKTRWFSVYLHQFFRSDIAVCLHDHPWHFVSIVLRGGYWEEMTDGKHWRRVGSVLLRPARSLHRIDLDPSKPKVWSLVFVTRKVRPWGFLTAHGWKAWAPGQGDPICETPNKKAHTSMQHLKVRASDGIELDAVKFTAVGIVSTANMPGEKPFNGVFPEGTFVVMEPYDSRAYTQKIRSIFLPGEAQRFSQEYPDVETKGAFLPYEDRH